MMVKRKIGERFSRLVIVGPPVRENGRSRWQVRCDCGNELNVIGYDLVRGHTRSCGCLLREFSSQLTATHRQTETAEYRSWCKLKERCSRTSGSDFKDYGARGIKVCNAWANSFETFLADMGPKPGPGYSIERKENDGNYEPNNCIWATKKAQARNRRSSAIVEFDGRKMCIAEAAEIAAIPAARVYYAVWHQRISHQEAFDRVYARRRAA